VNAPSTRFIIEGGRPLNGTIEPAGNKNEALRACMALLGAALCAEGRSLINNVQQIDRGYERIDKRLRLLGASITRDPV